MSVPAMILTAAMVVPGNGPEMVAGEMVQELRPLDLSGEWEGVWYQTDGTKDKMRVRQGDMTFGWAGPLKTSYIVDEGKGFCRFSVNRWIMLGIYRQDNERVMICFRDNDDNKRPTSFKRTSVQHLILLHRVKARK